MSENVFTAHNECQADDITMRENLRKKQRQDKHPHLLTLATALVIFIFLYWIGSSVIASFFLKDYDLIDDFSFNMILIIVPQLLCMLPPVLIMCTVKKMDFLSVMRLRKGVNLLQIAMLVGISYGLIYVANGMNNIFLIILEETTGYVSGGSGIPINNVWQMLFASFIYGILPAFCEEFFFRGLAMRSLERYSPTMAVIGSAVLFGIMHGNISQLFFAMTMGVVLAIVVRQTDSLVPAMIIHFSNNAIAIIFNYISRFISSGAAESTVAATAFDNIISSISMISMGLPFVAIIIPYIIYTKKRNKRKYGNSEPEELRKGYTEILQAENVTINKNGEVVQIDRAGKARVLAIIFMIIFIANQVGQILLDYVTNIMALAS